MTSSLLLCVSFLCLETIAPTDLQAAPQPDLTAYESAKAKVGRDPDAQFRLALWCEAQGLTSERLKHLALAVLTNPAHVTARGLLGLVPYKGQWKTPEAIKASVQHAENSSFFVGLHKFLVHDNSLVQPLLKPFDAVSELAAHASVTP